MTEPRSDAEPHSIAEAPAHRATAMRGRDRHEDHRTATPLELLFDLTFVIAFGIASAQFAHQLAEGHYQAGLIGFSFAMFAVCWAWVNFSWFASAYDNDDWIFRVTTMVQMAGVLILALGLPRMFKSIDGGPYLDNMIMVFGYVVMRLAMVFQWLRAATQDPARRKICLIYAVSIIVAQIGWVIQAIADISVLQSFLCGVPLIAIELLGPVLAERREGGTPWHAHHIAERYGLLAIIALGEGVVGTVATISAIVEQQGWSIDAVLICLAGTGLTFGMWWVYFTIPSAQVLHAHRERCFVWGYGHMFIFAAIAATGAGLHVAGLYIEHKAHISALATMMTVAVPVGLYLLMLYLLYTYLMQEFDRFHFGLIAGTAVVLVAAVFMAAIGVRMTLCLAALALAPLVTIIGYEMVGYRHQTQALQRVTE
ncbi:MULTISPECIES: low temperature requirement protein A [unclassified Beijerinckia]|uniref:low temperature requirement protein A n=1 Tax=unclassified Beijerinckia TaxID=2638183 RepID=UPI00089CF329|nr:MULTISPECIES: low temperature requirement protein A [unclassified Beijerinckia]MDH7799512.1 low temperature requirement protein LtrA [Beijerinckia sp. GAS462]SEB45614.1 Low temperature requirement protein LtrA [Beijerinckia sp. 28-YEA-48]